MENNVLLSRKNIADRYCKLISKNDKIRDRDAAEQLKCSELELLLAVKNAERLDITPTECINTFGQLGQVMSLTRNEACVLEHRGVFESIDIIGEQMATVIGPIETRAFFHGWKHFIRLEYEKSGKTMRSIQVFDTFGDAVTKIYLEDEKGMSVFNNLKINHEQLEYLLKSPSSKSAKAPESLDRSAFIDAWKAISDPHDFFGMLRTFDIGRYAAMEQAEGECTFPFPTQKIPELLEALVQAEIPVMIFAGNRGNIQIHQDFIRRVVPLSLPNGREWINIMDPKFNMHLRMDLLGNSWVVYKPSSDGPVWSIEAYDYKGELAVQFFGLRKPGIPQPEEWKVTLDQFAQLT